MIKRHFFSGSTIPDSPNKPENQESRKKGFFKKMIRKKDNIFSEESGQSLVLVAMSMVVIMGFAAFGIDCGQVHYAQIDLQDAADAAAISGANKLPSASSAVSTAKTYAVANGAQAGRVTVNTPYNGDSSLVEVICEKEVPYSFARVLGFTKQDIRARAVAKKNSSIWAGEALPFLNLDDDYTDNIRLEVWESTGPGLFESIWKDEREYVPYPIPHFNIQYEDGIAIQDGMDASIKGQIQTIYDHCRSTGDPVFVFSLRADVIQSGKYEEKNVLKNKTVIDLEDLVLLKVSFDDFTFEGGHGASVHLTVLDVFDFNAGHVPTEADYSAYGGNATLVE